MEKLLFKYPCFKCHFWSFLPSKASLKNPCLFSYRMNRTLHLVFSTGHKYPWEHRRDFNGTEMPLSLLLHHHIIAKIRLNAASRSQFASWKLDLLDNFSLFNSQSVKDGKGEVLQENTSCIWRLRVLLIVKLFLLPRCQKFPWVSTPWTEEKS